MKFLLLDIDDTISPWLYKGIDAVVIDSMGIELGIPRHIADWLKKVSKEEVKIIWCTNRPSVVCTLIEKTNGFKSEGKLTFTNRKAYPWDKLWGIIEFSNNNSEHTIVLVDNDVTEGTKGINNLPNNLKLISPSDQRRGCLSVRDLETIDKILKIEISD